jgi:hypothetical protein
MSEPSFGDTVAAFNAANTSEGESTPAVAPQDSPTNVPSFTQQQAPQTQQPTGSNPAYAEYLSKIPEGFRGVVEPIFKEWDQGVNKRFEQVHSRYDPYKPFIESQVDPRLMRSALDFYELVNTDPKRVYEALAEHFGNVQGQGQALDEPEEEFDLGEGGQTQQVDITKHPQFVQLKQQMDALVNGMQEQVQQREQQQLAAEGEQWLESRHTAAEDYLKNKVGITPDKNTWNYIYGTTIALSQANPNGDNDAAFAQAVDSYVEQINTFRRTPSANGNAPTVLPTGGGTPSNVIPNDISDKDRRKLAVDMFSQALKDA